METSVNIDIFSREIRVFQLLNEDDHKHISSIWNTDDPELETFVKGTALDGAKKWADISVLQYRFLIMQALEDVSVMEAEMIDEDNDNLKRLRFFVGAMLYKYHDDTSEHIEHLKIQHISSFKVNFEMIISQTIAIDAATSSRSGLRIVVDNTKEDEGGEPE